MRTDNRSLVLATLGGLFTAMACTLITDVDRQKIKPPGPTGEGGEGASGGSSGRGGQGGKAGRGGDGGSGGTAGSSAGTAGTAGTAPQGGQAGEGGAPGTGGTSGGGTGGSAGTSTDPGGAGGESGAPAVCGNGVMESGETCDDGNVATCGTCSADCSATRTIPAGEDASITIEAGTNIADGDTFTVNDGTDTAVFEFECDAAAGCATGATGVGSGNVAINFTSANFDGMDDEIEYRDLIIAAIDGAGLLADASDAGSAPAMLSITGVETLSDTVGAPTFVPAVRCRPSRSCNGDNVCLSNSCTTGTCD